MDFGKMEEEYFWAEGWTGMIGLKWLGKMMVLARQNPWHRTFNRMKQAINSDQRACEAK
jgi:hypothetical protein